MIRKIRNLFLNEESVRYQTGMSIVFWICIRLLGFIATWLLALLLDPDELGIYSYAFSIISMLSLVSLFGMHTFVVRELPKQAVQNEWGKIKGVVFWVLRTSLVISIVVAILGHTITKRIPILFDQVYLDTIQIGFYLLPFLGLILLTGNIIRGMGRLTQGLFIKDGIKGLLWCLSLAVVYIIGKSDLDFISVGSQSVMFLQITSTALALIVGGVILLRVWPKSASPSPPKYEIYSWRRNLIPFGILAILAFLNNNIDIIMLGSLSIPSQIGIYKIAFKFSTLVTFGLTAIRLAIAPHLSKLYSQEDHGRLERVTLLAARASFLFALPVGIGLFFFWPYIVDVLFNSQYLTSYGPLVILGIGELLSAVFGPLALLLNMTEFEKDSALIITTFLILNVILNLFFIPVSGAIGAAIATTVAKVLMNVVLWVKVKQRFGFYVHPFGFVKELIVRS